MNKQNRKNNFLRKFLTTAAIAPMIIGAGNVVFADDIDDKNAVILTGNPVATSGLSLEEIQRVSTTSTHLITAALEQVVVEASDTITARMSHGGLNDLRQPAGVPGGSYESDIPYGLWITPIYNQAVQKKKNEVVGYRAKSGGAIIGFDSAVNDNLTLGAAVTVIKTDMKYKDYKSGDKTAANTLMFSLYGSQQLVKDFFVQALASFGSAKIKNKSLRLDTVTTTYSTARAHYNSMFFGGEVLVGYNVKLEESVLLTPMAGIRYNRFNDEGYTETGVIQKLNVSKKATNKVEATIGARIATAKMLDGIIVVPEAHAFISQNISGKAGKVNNKLDNYESFISRADKTAKTYYNLGLGITAKSGMMEYGVGYDAYLASKYVGHQGSLKLRVNF
jgi:outer membrane autotransporter protein